MNDVRKKSKILYVGPFQFPASAAASRRILGNSRSLVEAGFDVCVACDSGDADYDHADFHGISIVHLHERFAEKLPSFLKHLSYLFIGKKTIDWLDALDVKPAAIILYSGYSPYLIRLIPWCRKNNVALLFDAVEWYQPATRFNMISPYQLNIELAMRWLVPKVDGIISISSYLAKYYYCLGKPVVLIPPTMVPDNFPFSQLPFDAKPMKLVYAGSPGNKDYLDNMISAVLSLYAEGYSIHLTVVGIDFQEALLKYKSVSCDASDMLKSCVKFVGRVSHKESIDFVSNAHFSVILRKNARYSTAGFPTKFVESLAVGTPVIANITSDLHMYLKDEVNGFECPDFSSASLKNTILRVLNISEREYFLMRESSRKTAVECFGYSLFSDSIGSFINKLI